MEKEAEKQQKMREKINKVKRDSERGGGCVGGKVAAANKQAKVKAAKERRIERRREVKAAEEAQIAEG